MYRSKAQIQTVVRISSGVVRSSDCLLIPTGLCSNAYRRGDSMVAARLVFFCFIPVVPVLRD
jgi:hypothetical protein